MPDDEWEIGALRSDGLNHLSELLLTWKTPSERVMSDDNANHDAEWFAYSHALVQGHRR